MNALKVLLAHQPRSASSAADAGYGHQLSGHTHGGQFWPWNLFVRLQQPFVAGLNRRGGMWIYCESGVLKQLPIKLVLRLGEAGIITRRDQELSPGAQAMRNELRAAAARLYPDRKAKPD